VSFQAGSTEADDLALQIITNIGLAAALQGNIGERRSPGFQSLLAHYRGPISAAEAAEGFVSRSTNAQNNAFSKFSPPAHPRLALLAPIEGRVDLQLTLDSATGQGLGASATSGHPLLKPGAMEAARRQRFEPSSLHSDTLNLTLDFALRCP